MRFNEPYDKENFIRFTETLLPNFIKTDKEINLNNNKSKIIKNAQVIGISKDLGNTYVLEFSHEKNSDPRISITRDAFKIMNEHRISKCLAIFKNDDSKNFRLSLLTREISIDENNKLIKGFSNAKRYSFYLGEGTKIKTPETQLYKKGRVKDFDDLKERFSLEVVNKEFYEEISNSFNILVGGRRTYKNKIVEHEPQLKLPINHEQNQKYLEFAVRLIGRIIFCWFLKEKRSSNNRSLMPELLLSKEATKKDDYYHNVLEPIFFEILNRPVKNRKEEYSAMPFSEIPYLNGGLFSPQEDDFYDYIESRQKENKKKTVIPNSWFTSLFEILESYNFTIDENTSFDEELSIDPEMLGRIFENLLAEINPETGDSARKNTGSYYTPRVIVDYMIDESLLLYLTEKTRIDENKLRSVITYDLEDDLQYPLSDYEKESIINYLSIIKILDPACGSGAFPIGVLQKIVFILQQIDPMGQTWFKKQIENTPSELKKIIEREFKEKNFDYIRKLGVIKENIYGIDIQPIATEISRLRCFLTLIVDERIDDSIENRGIEPLPNLDFKFVTANTLIKLPASKESKTQVGLFEDSKGIEELKELRSLFFNASGFERDHLKLQFSQTQNRMLNKLISENSNSIAQLTSKLTSWDPFGHKTSEWFDSEWMFGVNKGFDVIIGNPPYVRVSGINELYDQTIRKMYKCIFGHYDLYIPFIEFSLNLLSENGILSFITPNKFLSKKYGNKLRPYILKNFTISKLLDLSKVNVFDSASVYSLISIFQNKTPTESTITNVQSLERWKNPEEITFSKIYQSTYTSNPDYLIDIEINQEERSIFEKMNSNTIKIKDIARVLTGTPAIKLYYEWPKIIKEYQKESSNEFLKIINVSNLHRYTINWGGIVRIANHKYENAVIEFDEKLIGKNKWEIFKIHPKITIKGTALKLTGALDEVGYANVSLYSIVFNNKEDFSLNFYILGLINSKLLNYWYTKKYASNNLSGNYITFNGVYLSQLPLPKINDMNVELKKNIESNVLEIINLKKTKPDIDIQDLEKEINDSVYKIYKLNPTEIEIVDKY